MKYRYLLSSFAPWAPFGLCLSAGNLYSGAVVGEVLDCNNYALHELLAYLCLYVWLNFQQMILVLAEAVQGLHGAGLIPLCNIVVI